MRTRRRVALCSDSDTDATDAPKAPDASKAPDAEPRRTRKPAKSRIPDNYLATGPPKSPHSRPKLPTLEEEPEPGNFVFAPDTEPHSRSRGGASQSQGTRRKPPTNPKPAALKTMKQAPPVARKRDLDASSDDYEEPPKEEAPPKKLKPEASSKTALHKTASKA